ncbi:hypothetical protein OG871_20385 [Kitasatospora sp. NBC_00374]|uniref:hypothetical protein n=1 Tax=Kitasatospora sp. NBC_00374 TaxID=2975964 RepID=UPI0030E18C2F
MTDTTEPLPEEPGRPPTAPPVQPPAQQPAQPAVAPQAAPQAAPPSAPAPVPPPAQPWAAPATGATVDEVWALPMEAALAEQARRPRRAALLRWGGAALILVLTGTATAVAVTAPERTSLPGLRTPNDGRYAFPPLSLPPLPAGKEAPGKADLHRHFADLRQLLLPAPAGATLEQPAPDASTSASAGATPSAGPSPAISPSPGTSPTGSPSTGSGASPTAGALPAGIWADCNGFAAGDKNPEKTTAALLESACRAATKRVWTGPDGTRTEIWLLQFGSNTEANRFYERTATKSEPKDTAALHRSDLVFSAMPSVAAQARATGQKTDGRPVAQAADIAAGDVVARIVMTNPQGVPEQAFRQVAVLQADLLA